MGGNFPPFYFGISSGQILLFVVILFGFIMKKTTSPYIVIKKSGIHRKGVFAKKNIPEGTRVIEYVGEKITHTEADRRTESLIYAFILNKRHCIDGDAPYNTAKNINHSCDPNCEVDIIRGHIWIIAIKDIEKGEEITYNYNFDFDKDYKDHPCKCGTKKCIGFILDEDEWPKLKRHLKKKSAE